LGGKWTDTTAKEQGVMKQWKVRRSFTRLVEIGGLPVLPIIGHLFLPIIVLIPSPYRYFGILLMVLGLLTAISASNAF
jgi:hypothetical protein